MDDLEQALIMGSLTWVECLLTLLSIELNFSPHSASKRMTMANIACDILSQLEDEPVVSG